MGSKTLPERSEEFITFKEVCQRILLILECEKTVGVKWHNWDGTYIPKRFPERINNMSDNCDNEIISILCSMLCIALNRDFGEELFKDYYGGAPSNGRKKNDSDKIINDFELINFLKKLFENIKYMWGPVINENAIKTYDSFDKYINFLDEKYNQGDCLIPFWYFNEISTFVYVFYVHLLVDLNTENSYVSRRDISDLFWNIYSSKEIVNLFFKISLKKMGEISADRFLTKPTTKYKQNYVFYDGEDYSFSETIFFSQPNEENKKTKLDDNIKKFINFINNPKNDLYQNKECKVDALYDAMDQYFPDNCLYSHQEILEEIINIGLLSFSHHCMSENDIKDYTTKLHAFLGNDNG